MKHYTKTIQEKSLTQIIFHIETNNLVTNKDSNETANEIVQFAKTSKTDKNKVTISSLVRAKTKEVNTFLKEKCKESNFDLISYFSINPYRFFFFFFWLYGCDVAVIS